MSDEKTEKDLLSEALATRREQTGPSDDLGEYFKSPQWLEVMKRSEGRRKASFEHDDFPYGKPIEQWEHRGVRCVLLMGCLSLCGYVRVPPGHPWYDKEYDDVGADVWGGLTFRCRDREGCDWYGWDNAHLYRCPRTEREETTLLADQVADAAVKT